MLGVTHPVMVTASPYPQVTTMRLEMPASASSASFDSAQIPEVPRLPQPPKGGYFGYVHGSQDSLILLWLKLLIT